MTTKTIRQLHFSVDSKYVLNLCRQAYWMENRKEWALNTLRCYNGITESQIENLLNGTASLGNHEDGERAIYIDSPDTEWQETVAKHLQWLDSRTYVFAGRRLNRELMDNYVNNIVKRLRDSMKLGAVTMMNPIYIMDLEQQREEQHNEIFLQAGFTQAEIDLRTTPTKWSKEFADFDKQFSAYLDKQTDWFFNKDTEQ